MGSETSLYHADIVTYSHHQQYSMAGCQEVRAGKLHSSGLFICHRPKLFINGPKTLNSSYEGLRDVVDIEQY